MATFSFDHTGALALPDTNALLKADEDSAVVVYVCGVVDDGRPYYAYIAVKPSLYPEFARLSAAQAEITPEAYGIILASGFAAEAPAEVIADMRHTYGFDETYLEKLRQGVIFQYHCFLKEKEDKRLSGIIAQLQKK